MRSICAFACCSNRLQSGPSLFAKFCCRRGGYGGEGECVCVYARTPPTGQQSRLHACICRRPGTGCGIRIGGSCLRGCRCRRLSLGLSCPLNIACLTLCYSFFSVPGADCRFPFHQVERRGGAGASDIRTVLVLADSRSSLYERTADEVENIEILYVFRARDLGEPKSPTWTRL